MATNQSRTKMSAGKKVTKTKGFENNANKIAAKQGVSKDRARAILASGARKASPAAKKANPNLTKVLGKKK